MSQYVLGPAILKRSVAKTWDEARMEWELERVYMDADQTCLCSHYPISEMCVLRNTKNGNRAIVGNCCVEKFMGISSDKLFAAIKRVKKDLDKPFNADVIKLAQQRGYLDEREYGFYLDTWRKRKLTDKQMRYRHFINVKLLHKLKPEQA